MPAAYDSAAVRLHELARSDNFRNKAAHLANSISSRLSSATAKTSTETQMAPTDGSVAPLVGDQEAKLRLLGQAPSRFNCLQMLELTIPWRYRSL
jgi:hypothetical protein